MWLHNAIDVPGGYGETARAVFAERVTRPLAVGNVGNRSEFLRLPLFAYVHIRFGRDVEERQLEGSPFEVLRDADGKVWRVRIHRGTRIDAGQALGTLNRLNHVHLTMGPPAAEMNILSTLELPGLTDTIAPTIERVALANSANALIGEVSGAPQKAPIEADGPVRVLVDAWDQHDGNADRRRLGLFRLGYQVLDASGAPVAGYEQPRMTISLEHLPSDPRAGRLVYADGSRSWFSGPTVFVYEITNVVRDGEAREARLDLSALARSQYTLRVFAEDAFGNRSIRDVSIVR